jgi:hypothetical protein
MCVDFVTESPLVSDTAQIKELVSRIRREESVPILLQNPGLRARLLYAFALTDSVSDSGVGRGTWSRATEPGG